MDLTPVDTQIAYQRIREKITSLELEPGSPIDEGILAEEIEVSHKSLQEALISLAREGLVELKDRGLYVSVVEPEQLQQISELRALLEGFSARLAAQRAEEDDLLILNALREEQGELTAHQADRLFELDHKFHQAIAQASKNPFLARELEMFYGLSLRMWNLVLPKIDFLENAVEEHKELLTAIEAGNPEVAERLMCQHVGEFYQRIQELLKRGG